MGIGAAIKNQLRDEGHNVIVVDIRQFKKVDQAVTNYFEFVS